MRFGALCVIASMTAAPFSCGSPGTSTTTKPAAAPPKVEKPSEPKKDADPLVPPIDLGDGNLTSSEFSKFDFSAGDNANFHAHGQQVCASGCAASRHPTGVLSKAKYLWLLRRFAEQPTDENSSALETLLYFGRQTQLWMDKLGTRDLGAERVALLRRELKRTHAIVRFRIIDEYGVVRVTVPPTRVPLDRRHVFRMETKDLPPLITSGTVKRVGLHHLWTRL